MRTWERDMRWVIGIVVVVVLVIIGYQYFGDRGVDVAEQPEVGTDEAQVTEEPAEEPPAEVAEPAEQPAEQPAEETEQAAEEPAGAVEEPTEEAADATEETAEEPATATGQAGEQAAETTEQTAEAPAETAEEPATPTEQVGEQVTGAVQNVEEALQGITDAQSAEAAVPALNAVNVKLEELSGTVDQLPDDGKKVLADVLNERVAELKTLAADVTAQEGVGEVVNPALEPII